MVILVLVAMAGLVLLALAVSSRPVSHLHDELLQPGRTTRPPARPWSQASPPTPLPATRAATRRRTAMRCTRRDVDWSRLMETPGRRTTVEADR